MKIAVLATGGTIGSKRQEDGWITQNQEQIYEILERYRESEFFDSSILFDCFSPYRILSEALNAHYLETLIQAVTACLEADCYDGIIICHGTDTLQYTAAILAWVYQEAGTPICLVSSNYPLQDTRANGLDNFRYAVETIKKGLRGVMVVYRNSDMRIYVHKGTSLLAHQTFEDNLYSVDQSYLGVYETDGSWKANPAWDKEKETPAAVPYHGLKMATSEILWLREYPGYVYPEPDKNTKAVMIEAYHSGTLGVRRSLETLCKKAKEMGIPVYLLGAASDKAGYETMKEYKRLGLIVLPNAAPIALYCRLWLELGKE